MRRAAPYCLRRLPGMPSPACASTLTDSLPSQSRRWVGEPQTRQLLGAGRDPRGSRAAPLRSSNDDSAGVGARSKADRNMEEEGAAAEEEEPAGVCGPLGETCRATSSLVHAISRCRGRCCPQWENEPSFDELELSPELYEEL